jgi:hypothetical protein
MAIILLILVFLILLYCFHYNTTNKLINEYFDNGNVIVYGAKGKGKDLLFQKRIYMKKKKYLSNISYGYKGEILEVKNLNVDPNTYENFINGDITKCEKNEEYENVDYYLSDGGIFLPCQYDYLLHKKYPSFPIYYALSRHLYNSNIHVNCQALSRVWKAIREQADRFIKCEKVIKLPFILICKIRMYDKYESALNNLLPMKTTLANKYSKALVEQYKATNGEILTRYYVIRKKDIQYNTRHFENVVFSKETK